MSSSSYKATGFLQSDSDFEIESAAHRLSEWLPGWKIDRKGKTVAARSPGCEFHVHLADEPFVAEEAKEIASWHPDCPKADDIAACRRRVEIWCPTPDPEMEHFNDFVFVCQAMEGFRGMILFDDDSGQLL